MPLNLLTDREVKAKRARGRYADGGGLVLQISKWGTKSWAFRYRWVDKDKARDRHMGLGSVHTLSLAEARDRAQACRKLLLEGLDPIVERRNQRNAKRVADARTLTFKECAEKYIEAHAAAWRNEKHRAQWAATLNAYAFPVIGALPVSSIDQGLVIRILEPIWKEKPETAKRLRGRIENILSWAAVRGLRSGDNPARWRGHLDKMLPAPGRVRAVKHHAALPYAQLPQFIGALRERADGAARALELTILTALRTSEVIGATWGEIDLGAKVWTVPASRMKMRRDHRAPLSARALELLASIRRESDRPDELVFPGASKRRPLSNMAMLKTLERMRHGDVTVHGFRSTFRDWAAETTAFPNHVVEMALAHAVGDKVEAAYRRGDLFEKRRRLMDAWASYCNRPASAGDVVAMRGRRQ